MNRSAPVIARKRLYGTTLLELLVTLSIAVILMTVAVPSFQSTLSKNRVASVTNEMVRALHLARSEAVNRGQSVSICNTSDPHAEEPDCSGGTWADGWIIFVDPNNHGVIDSGETIIRVGTLSNTNATIKPTDIADRITYSPDGSGQKGKLEISVGDEKRDIEIEATGRTRVYKP